MKLTPDHPAGVEVPGTRSARVLADLASFAERYRAARIDDGQPCIPCNAPAPVVALRRAAVASAVRHHCRAAGVSKERTQELIDLALAAFAAGASAADAIDQARKEVRRG